MNQIHIGTCVPGQHAMTYLPAMVRCKEKFVHDAVTKEKGAGCRIGCFPFPAADCNSSFSCASYPEISRKPSSLVTARLNRENFL